MLPAPLSVHRERTAPGATIVVAGGGGPVTVEAWLGGGTSDEGTGEAGLAHLAEHLALAQVVPADRAAGGVGLDGWVGPDATVFRAIGGAGALVEALAAIVGAVGAPAPAPSLVAAEASRVAAERDHEAPRARLLSWLWGRGPGSAVVPVFDGVAIERWWRTSFAPARTTIAIRGADDPPAAARLVAAAWPAPRSLRPSRGRAERPPVRAPAPPRARPPLPPGWWAIGGRVARPDVDDLAALTVAAAAARLLRPWSGLDHADVVASRTRAAWIVTGRGQPPTARELARGLAALASAGDAVLAAARVGAGLPLVGVDDPVGELAAGQHLFGDPAWAARLRARLATVEPAAVAAVVRRRLAGRVRVAGGRAARGPGPAPRRPRGPGTSTRPTPGAPPAPSPRAEVAEATLPAGTRVIAMRVPGATEVAIHVAWRGGFADEGEGERGVVAVLAAAAPASCAAVDAAAEAAALGGELAGVAGRWSLGLRSRWSRDRWRDGLALVLACARSPALDAAAVSGERTRLLAMARGLAGSPTRAAYLAYLAARWGRHPLGRDVLPPPGELAGLDHDVAARWWQARYAPGPAVVVIVGDLAPAAAVAAVRERLAGAPRLRASSPLPPPPPPPLRAPIARQLFVDGPPATAAVVIGLPGLAADAAERPWLDGLAAILGAPGGRVHAAATAAGARSLRVAVVDGPGAGYLALELEAAPPADAVVAAVAGALRALAAGGPTAAELELARAALVPAAEPSRLAAALVRAELVGAAPGAGAPADEATLRALVAALVRWDEATVVTVRPADMTPGVRARATRPLPPRRGARPRRPR